jgi:hypothetical protein
MPILYMAKDRMRWQHVIHDARQREFFPYKKAPFLLTEVSRASEKIVVHF